MWRAFIVDNHVIFSRVVVRRWGNLYTWFPILEHVLVYVVGGLRLADFKWSTNQCYRISLIYSSHAYHDRLRDRDSSITPQIITPSSNRPPSLSSNLFYHVRLHSTSTTDGLGELEMTFYFFNSALFLYVFMRTTPVRLRDLHGHGQLLLSILSFVRNQLPVS